MRTFTVDDVVEVTSQLQLRGVPHLEKLVNGNVRAQSAGLSRCVSSVHPHGVNGLLLSVHRAFSEHRALTLSPDDVWITILNGFAHHVRVNAESLRERFVEFEGRRTLTVETADANWEANILLFERALADALNPGLMHALTDSFSTTTADAHVAFCIASMDAFSAFFDLEMITVCGIPRVTLTGTVDDWKAVRERFRVLTEYDLQWWHAALAPVLDQFVASAAGQIDLEFWRSIYKPKKSYGQSQVTGWVLRLFPYLELEAGVFERNAFEHDGWIHEPLGPDVIPLGLSNVQLRHRMVHGEEELLSLHSGIFGVQQLADSSVAPVIGWTVAHSPIESVFDAIARQHRCTPAVTGRGWMGPVLVPALLGTFTSRFGGASLYDGALTVLEAPQSSRDERFPQFINLKKVSGGGIRVLQPDSTGLHFATARDGRRLVFVPVEAGLVLLVDADNAEPPYPVLKRSLLGFLQSLAHPHLPLEALPERWSPPHT